MAKNIPSAVLLLAILGVITTASLAQTLINGTPIAQAQILGVLACTTTGIPIPLQNSLPLVGINVTLSCDGGTTTLGQAVTNTAGFYNVTIGLTQSILFDTSSCALYAPLPISTCSVFPTTGVLRIPFALLTTVPGVLGNVGIFVGQVLNVVA